MTVLDMADARSWLVGVAAPEVRILSGDPRAGHIRGLAGRHLESPGWIHER